MAGHHDKRQPSGLFLALLSTAPPHATVSVLITGSEPHLRSDVTFRARLTGPRGESGCTVGVHSMNRISWRVTAVVLSLIAAGLISLPSNSSQLRQPVSVDRTLKGDRLPFAPGARRPAASKTRSSERIPVGCEGAFSPISSPRLANIFRRCAV
jgi:hypothetical protein